MNRYIEHANQQYRKFEKSRNEEFLFLYTHKEGVKTFRMSGYRDYLTERGEEWIRLGMCDKYDIENKA